MVRGLVPGATPAKPVWDVGGVLGGVMGSKAEPDGEGESVLSSVRLSGASGAGAEEPERYEERRDEVVRPNAAVKWE